MVNFPAYAFTHSLESPNQADLCIGISKVKVDEFALSL